MKPQTAILVFLAISIFFFYGCPNNYGYKYDYGTFPESPVNFEALNTEYDDYNMSAPAFGETFPLCFSSTRNSQGSNYDIVYKLVSIEFSREHGTLDIYENTASNLDVFTSNSIIYRALNKINTSYDELGPYLIPLGVNYDDTTTTERFNRYIVLYSNNENGHQDILFTENLQSENFENPEKVSFLNSEFDDAYPTFNIDNSEMYFTSNRESDFDIYKVKTDNSKDLIEILTDSSMLNVEKDQVLSSDFDDKCPYIINDVMVFASNREGGFGGYDLYFSKLEDGQWSAPQNFGEKINTEYDEYRPILRPQDGFINDFLLFSSNRPGGKGGFDLYYVGVEKIVTYYY